MEKVRITQNQEVAIKSLLESKEWTRDEILTHHIMNKWSTATAIHLNKLSVDEITRILYEPNSYEVEPEFKVGDYITHKRTRVIKEIDEDIVDFINKHYFDKENIRLATPEEIKQEKEYRWWSGHGREVWELKVGDIVKLKIGGLIEVDDISYSDIYEIKFTDRHGKKDAVKLKSVDKLIVTAENRLDVDSNG